MSKQIDVTKQINVLQTRADALLDAQEDAEEEIQQLRDRVDELEAENDRLRRRVEQLDEEAETVPAIVDYAKNKRSGQPVVKVKPKEIAGAAGISERYGYKLCNPQQPECLANDYAWILTPDEMQQYGAVEMDLDAQERAIGIDFEGVHSPGVPLNRFNNGHGRKEGSE